MCNKGIVEIIFEEIAKEYPKLDEINASANPRTTTNSNHNKEITPKHIIIKLLKDEQRIFKAAGEDSWISPGKLILLNLMELLFFFF